MQNHGPTVSIYYQDPDGNTLETQVDCFDTPEEATELMESPDFGINPIGTDFDPEELCRAVEAGEDDRKLKVRESIGARGSPEDMEVIMEKWASAKVGV